MALLLRQRISVQRFSELLKFLWCLNYLAYYHDLSEQFSLEKPTRSYSHLYSIEIGFGIWTINSPMNLLIKSKNRTTFVLFLISYYDVICQSGIGNHTAVASYHYAILLAELSWHHLHLQEIYQLILNNSWTWHSSRLAVNQA